MSELLKETKDGVLVLTLNRPEKKNALNDVLVGELINVFADLSEAERLCAVVIRGAGSDFCSGADLSALQKIADSNVLENLADAERLVDLFLLMRKYPVPVIAAVHGRALAGGCGLATACDLVLATETAKFGYPEVKIGFVAAIVMAILRRNVPEKRAFELVTQGFEFGSRDAAEYGLVNRVFPEDEFETGIEQCVATYRKVSGSAVRLSKKLLYQMDGLTFGDAVTAGAQINTIARLTPDCRAGIARFLKRD